MVCRPKKPDHNTIKLKINNRRKTGKYFLKKVEIKQYTPV